MSINSTNSIEIEYIMANTTTSSNSNNSSSDSRLKGRDYTNLDKIRRGSSTARSISTSTSSNCCWFIPCFGNNGNHTIPMTTKERLRLSAWQKWKLYGRFPWKLTLHLLLLLLTTLRLLSWNVSNDEYFRATSRTFTYFFLPEDYEFPADRAYTIYTFESATKAIERVVKNYEEINSFSVDTYQHFLLDKPDPSGIAIHNIMPVTLTFQQLGNLTDDISKQHDGTAKINGKLKTTSYNISSKDLGPFDVRKHGVTNVNKAITSIYIATLSFELKGYNIVGDYRICIHWHTTVTFDFSSRGMITMFLKVHPTDDGCEADTHLFSGDFSGYSATWLDIPILLIAFLYIILAVKKLRQQIKLYLYLKRRAFLRENRRLKGDDVIERSVRWMGRPVTWQSLKCGDKLRFFDLWFVFTILACTCSCMTSLLSLLSTHMRGGEVHRLLGSLGCSLLWVNLVRYLQYNRNYYMVILTIRYASPRVLRFLVGVLPIMMGYAFFGMTYFGSESDRFSDFGSAMVTLFAVLNGDVIRETFLNLLPVYPVISQIYLYTFICLFIYVVLNVFIAIVEEAFFMSRRTQGGNNSVPNHHQQMLGGSGDSGNMDNNMLEPHHGQHIGNMNPSSGANSGTNTPTRSSFSSNIPISPSLGGNNILTSDERKKQNITLPSTTPLDDAMLATNSSWTRFQEFLHLNDVDELMNEVTRESGNENYGNDNRLNEPLINNGGQLEEKC